MCTEDQKMNYVYKFIQSPVGKLKLVASDEGLAAILWENDNPNRVKVHTEIKNLRHPILVEAEQQLKEYFEKKRRSFSLKLASCGTPFEMKVWKALSKIPYGETRTYGQIAKQIGSPKAARAVGAANRKNPISIVVPCHRVIGSTGKLTGFAGGLQTKSHLLELETSVL